MVLIPRLESLEVINFGFVQPKSKSVVEECVTWAVVTVHTALVHVRVNIAVQDRHRHRVVHFAAVAVHDVV